MHALFLSPSLACRMEGGRGGEEGGELYLCRRNVTELQFKAELVEKKREDFDVDIQGSAKRWSPGLVSFVPALAYHFCLALPAAFTQPGACLLAEPCRGDKKGSLRVARRANDMKLKIRVVLGVVVVRMEGRNKKVFLVSGPLLSLQGRPFNSAVRPMHVPSRAPPSSAP